MTAFFLTLSAVLGAMALLLKKIEEKEALAQHWPFYARKPLRTAEQALYFRLVEAFPNHIILPQVPLSSFLCVRQEQKKTEWISRIKGLRSDFLVCRKDLSIKAVVEMDAAAGRRANHRSAIEKKNKALEAASIKVIRLEAGSLPDVEVIRSRLLSRRPPEANGTSAVGEAS